jgi:hypothetical protein
LSNCTDSINSLPVSSVLKLLVLDDLDPVVVGILIESVDGAYISSFISDLPRIKATFFILPSVRRFFHETFMSSKRLQAASKSSTETHVWPTGVERVSTYHILGSGKSRRHTSLRLVVTVVILDAVVALRAVVVRQLENTLAISDRVNAVCRLLGSLGTVAEEVECEAGLLLFRSALEGHAHDVPVEFERLLSILDSDHGVVHAVCVDVRLLALGLTDGVLGDDFDPVAVGVEGESD